MRQTKHTTTTITTTRQQQQQNKKRGDDRKQTYTQTQNQSRAHNKTI